MKKSKEKFQKYLKINEAENKSLWDAAEIVLKWKFIATQAYFKK